LLNGVTRQILIEEARMQGIEVQETLLTVDDLWNADEIFLTASLSQVVVIEQVQHQLRSTHAPIAQQLFDSYEVRKQKYIHTKNLTYA
jgi:4-amino-4-deoxychorismate lyase